MAAASLARQKVWSAAKMYHTAGEIVHKVGKLRQTCAGMKTLRKANKLLRVDFASASPKGKPNIVVYCGEHARELISSEACLRLMEHLCFKRKDTREFMKTVRNSANIILYPLINYDGRELSEQGQYCLRVSPGGVDFNRNWDDHWDSSEKGSGSKPFSEKITQTLRDDAIELNPKAFFTVHSGQRALFTPFSYEERVPKGKNQNTILKYLNELKDQYCIDCQVGGAANVIGYNAPGSELDYFKEVLQTPIAVGMEIFKGPLTVPKVIFARGKPTDTFETIVPVSSESLIEKSGNLVTTSFPQPKVREANCFAQFNPMNHHDYEDTVETWSNILSRLIVKSAHLRSEE